MKISTSINQTHCRVQSAFTLPEVMMAVAIILITFGGFYLGFTQGFAIIQVARENLRATQILQEKAETIRLFTWDQILSAAASKGAYVTTNYFYPVAGTNSSKGTAYVVSRKVQFADPQFHDGEGYVNDIRVVTFTVTWNSGNTRRQRQMRTFVSQYGLHNYIVHGIN